VLSKISDNILTKGIEIIELIKDEAFVLADKNMVEAGTRNVISNAKKFTNKDGNINVALQCVKTGASKYCRLSVEDNGIGMSTKKRSELFSSAYQATKRGTEGTLGIGLGFSNSKEFIEKNVGSITVERELGRGSKVTSRLPLVELII